MSSTSNVSVAFRGNGSRRTSTVGQLRRRDDELELRARGHVSETLVPSFHHSTELEGRRLVALVGGIELGAVGEGPAVRAQVTASPVLRRHAVAALAKAPTYWRPDAGAVTTSVMVGSVEGRRSLRAEEHGGEEDEAEREGLHG
jgi:hypothetical protein